MNPRQTVYLFLLTIIISISAFFSLLYIYDPFQIFHKPWFREQTFHNAMRQQAAGIINNYEFDSVIIGTSMLQNTSAFEASKTLGGDFVNLSLSGSTFYERNIILNRLFHKINIAKVIYSLDEPSYIRQSTIHPHYPSEQFDFLYDNNPLNDMQLYLNDKFIKCLITFSKKTECIGKKTNLDRPTAWYNRGSHYKRFGGLENWFSSKLSKNSIKEFKKIVKISTKVAKGKIKSSKNLQKKIIKAKRYTDKYILDMVKSNPKTEFFLLFPPYSTLHFSILAQYKKDEWEIHKAILRYLAVNTKKYHNMRLFAWNDRQFPDKIKNYKDPLHYHYSFNSWMLNSIKIQRGLLNQNNINKYLKNIEKKALHYDLVGTGEKIDMYLKQ